MLTIGEADALLEDATHVKTEVTNLLLALTKQKVIQPFLKIKPNPLIVQTILCC
jgi:hypothetical protein